MCDDYKFCPMAQANSTKFGAKIRNLALVVFEVVTANAPCCLRLESMFTGIFSIEAWG